MNFYWPSPFCLFSSLIKVLYCWSSNSSEAVLIPFLLLKYYITEAETAEELSSFLFSYKSITVGAESLYRAKSLYRFSAAAVFTH